MTLQEVRNQLVTRFPGYTIIICAEAKHWDFGHRVVDETIFSGYIHDTVNNKGIVAGCNKMPSVFAVLNTLISQMDAFTIFSKESSSLSTDSGTEVIAEQNIATDKKSSPA